MQLDKSPRVTRLHYILVFFHKEFSETTVRNTVLVVTMHAVIAPAKDLVLIFGKAPTRFTLVFIRPRMLCTSVYVRLTYRVHRAYQRLFRSRNVNSIIFL